MRMRIIPVKYRFLLHSFTAILLAFFIHTLPVNAQKSDVIKETPGKKSSKKATRVFYGQASFYANKFNGRRTASGETFDQKKFTCACNVLPLGTWIKDITYNYFKTPFLSTTSTLTLVNPLET